MHFLNNLEISLVSLAPDFNILVHPVQEQHVPLEILVAKSIKVTRGVEIWRGPVWGQRWSDRSLGSWALVGSVGGFWARGTKGGCEAAIRVSFLVGIFYFGFLIRSVL